MRVKDIFISHIRVTENIPAPRELEKGTEGNSGKTSTNPSGAVVRADAVGLCLELLGAVPATTQV